MDMTSKTATPNHLAEPLTSEQLKARVDSDGRLKVVFACDLSELACSSNDGTQDGLNDIVDARVWAGFPCLSDICYRAVGVTPNGRVLVLIDADASEVLDEIDMFEGEAS
jgi:hypothetical protein